MKKFMKYEIKGTYKFILGILLVVLIASTVIQLGLQSDIKQLDRSTSFVNSSFGGLMLLTSILVIFGAFLTAFFYIIGSFRKELYEDRGYLTFTLPLTGKQILASKLLVSLLWYLVLGAGIIIYNIVLSLILFGNEWIYIVRTIAENINPGFVSVGVVSILSTLVTLILIYFSISLSKVSIRNKKIGGIWFIVFIVLNMIITTIIFKISTSLPYYLSLSDFSISHIYNIAAAAPGASSGLVVLGNEANALMFMGSDFKPYLNVFGSLFQLLVVIIGFLATGYLIENKVDI